jgi:hypothetical protein
VIWSSNVLCKLALAASLFKVFFKFWQIYNLQSLSLTFIF